MNEIAYKTKDERRKAKDTALLLVLGFILLISSCSTEKKTTKTNIKSYSASHLIKEIERNQFDFDNLETKIDIKMKGDSRLGLKGQMRIKKDSVIWISVSLKVGIEVGRIMITHDSIKFINRTAKTYFAESLDSFNDKLPIEPSFQFLQDLLIGNNTQIKKDERFRVTTEDEKYRLEMTQKEKKDSENSLLSKNIWIIPENFKISRYNIKENENREIQLEYDDFTSIDKETMPSKLIFRLSSDYDIEVEINYSDIKIGEELRFPFNISSKYDRVKVW